MNKLSIYIIIGVGVLSFYLIFFNNNKVTGFYYLDKTDLSEYTQSPELASLDECRAWVKGQVKLYPPSENGYDYECGVKCKFKSDWGMYVCKETMR